MHKAVEHYPGGGSGNVFTGDVSVTGNITSTGTIRAPQFKATADGTTTEYAYTWDADPNLGLRRLTADSATFGVGNNQPLTVTQFSANVNEVLVIGAGWSVPNLLVATAISGTIHNYNPSGWAGNRPGLLQDLSGAAVLTGLAATSNGHIARVYNTTTTAARTLTLNHLDALSTATNQFHCPNLVPYVLAPGEGVWIEYITNVWRVLGASVSTGP